MSSGSQPGERRGRRAPGTPNKRTVELVERLAELECNPLQGLAAIAADPKTDAVLRARVYADLLPYLYPRHSAMGLSGHNNTPMQISWITRTIVDPRQPNSK